MKQFHSIPKLFNTANETRKRKKRKKERAYHILQMMDPNTHTHIHYTSPLTVEFPAYKP